MVRFESAGGIAQDARELFAQLEAGAEEPDLYIGFGEAEQFGGFADRESLDVPQEKHQPVLFVEPGQCIFEQLAHFIAMDQLLGAGPPVGDVFGVRDFTGFRVRIGGLVEGDGVESLAFAQDFEGGVGGDPVQPGGEAGLFAEIVQVFEGGEEGLLGDVLGVVFVLGDAAGESVDPAFVAVSQFLEGVQVALFGPVDQLGVGWWFRVWFRHVEGKDVRQRPLGQDAAAPGVARGQTWMHGKLPAFDAGVSTGGCFRSAQVGFPFPEPAVGCENQPQPGVRRGGLDVGGEGPAVPIRVPAGGGV